MCEEDFSGRDNTYPIPAKNHEIEDLELRFSQQEQIVYPLNAQVKNNILPRLSQVEDELREIKKLLPRRPGNDHKN